jgi:predicted lipoprotein with Yx(FWY)xxD motif
MDSVPATERGGAPVRGIYAMVLAAFATIAAVAACSSGSGGGAKTTLPPATGTVRISQVAGVLQGPDGRTLYENSADSSTHVSCTGSCAEQWPPVIGTPVVTGVLQETDFSTIKRPDGSSQAVFEGHPLYYFAGGTPSSADLGSTWHLAYSSIVSTTGGTKSVQVSAPPPTY